VDAREPADGLASAWDTPAVALNDLRAILGNDIAIKASREGTLPFPDSTILPG
jgi:hypothetical protein